MEKEKNQMEHEHWKSTEHLNAKIQKLKELNAEKMADEQHIKTKEKKLNKKIRALEKEKNQMEPTIVTYVTIY